MRDHMRIAYVYDAVYPDITGGVERRIWEISKRLAARGHEVHSFGMHVWDGDATIGREGVTLHGICRSYPLYRKGRRRVFPAVMCSAGILSALANERYDIVDCQQFPYIPALASAAACRISGTPLVVTWHEVWGDYWYEYLGIPGAAGKFLERVLARHSVFPVAVSEITREDLYPLIPGRDIEVIPNGIDLPGIDSVPPAGIKSDIIFVGRLIREKHVDVLIDAVGILKNQYPGIRCLIIGGGPERWNLEMKARHMGLSDHITFTGFLRESREVIAHMKSSRVFVLPSTREGFGMAALEALACGIPVVTIDHPKNASRVFVRNGCGALSALDGKDLADKIAEMMIRESGRTSGCRMMVSGYDWEKITDTAELYYKRVCESIHKG